MGRETKEKIKVGGLAKENEEKKRKIQRLEREREREKSRGGKDIDRIIQKDRHEKEN